MLFIDNKVTFLVVPSLHLFAISIDCIILIFLREHHRSDSESLSDRLINNFGASLINQEAVSICETLCALIDLNYKAAFLVVITVDFLPVVHDPVEFVWLLALVGSLSDTLLHLLVNSALTTLV